MSETSTPVVAAETEPQVVAEPKPKARSRAKPKAVSPVLLKKNYWPAGEVKPLRDVISDATGQKYSAGSVVLLTEEEARRVVDLGIGVLTFVDAPETKQPTSDE